MNTTPLLAGLLLLAACGPRTAEDVADQPIQGSIEGVPWVFASGTAVVNGDSVSIDLYSSEVGCDDIPPTDEDRILFTAPAAVGEYELQFNLFNLDEARTVTLLAAPSSNIIMTDGFYAIDRLDTELDLVLYAPATDGQNEMEGRATLPVCE